MNKIVFFSDWKKMYQHPTPKVHPFVEVPFLDKGSYDDADAFVQINMQHTHHVKEPFREPFYNYIKQSGKPSIVFETAVLRENCAEHFKDKYYRFSWNSFLWDEGNFGPMGNGSDRWEKIQSEQHIEVKPWRTTKGDYILVILQHVIDTSLVRMIDHYGSYYNWFHHTLSLIRAHTDLPIVIRPHPKHGMYTEFFDAYLVPEAMELFPDVHWSSNQGSEKMQGGKYLRRDLDNAHAVVGWTSNALTEAAIYGVPVYPMSGGAMVCPVCPHTFSSIDKVNEWPDRQQWLNDLAYCQWTYDEIRDGIAWNHIKNANLS